VGITIDSCPLGVYNLDKDKYNMGHLDKENISKQLKKGGINMALLARPNNSVIKINGNTSKQFLEESKKNVVNPNFLKRCQDYSRMLNNNIEKK